MILSARPVGFEKISSWLPGICTSLTIVEHKATVKHQPANAIRDQFGHLADGRAAVAVADRDDVGQTVSDDELDNRLGRFGTADLPANPPSVSRHSGAKRAVAPVF
jgi:hypothetical protein